MGEGPRGAAVGPLRVTSEVISCKQVGAYHHLTLVADEIAQRALPGTFVAISVGGDLSDALQRRALWLHRVRPAGVYGGTIEVVFAVLGPGTRWLSRLRAQDTVDVIGPVGRAFSLPQEPVACALVADGHGAAPMLMLAERLRERDCAVHMVLGASNERGLLGGLDAKRSAQSVIVTTRDGSVGIKGTVTDALPAVLERRRIDVVYAGGPTEILRDVVALARAAGAWSQVALEAPMACGVGLCLSCVIPVVRGDGAVRAARCCVDGPVFAGETVAWSLL